MSKPVKAAVFSAGSWGTAFGTVLADDPRCRALMETLIAQRPALWNEDIGIED